MSCHCCSLFVGVGHNSLSRCRSAPLFCPFTTLLRYCALDGRTYASVVWYVPKLNTNLIANAFMNFAYWFLLWNRQQCSAAQLNGFCTAANISNNEQSDYEPSHCGRLFNLRFVNLPAFFFIADLDSNLSRYCIINLNSHQGVPNGGVSESNHSYPMFLLRARCYGRNAGFICPYSLNSVSARRNRLCLGYRNGTVIFSQHLVPNSCGVGGSTYTYTGRGRGSLPVPTWLGE